MGILYSDQAEPFSGRPVPYHRQKATEHYLRHFNNVLFLRAVQAAPKDIREKIQATREIGIAEKRMAYWQNHPNFDQAAAAQGCLDAKKAWSRN